MQNACVQIQGYHLNVVFDLYSKIPIILVCLYGVFSHDVTAAMLVGENNEMAAMLVVRLVFKK